MRISRTPNATPKSTPPSGPDSRGGADASAGDEQFIWRSLLPRLVHPTRLQIIEVLIDKGSPMSVEELTPLVPLADGNIDLVRYHAKAMIKAGVLGVAQVDPAKVEGQSREPCLFFALPK